MDLSTYGAPPVAPDRSPAPEGADIGRSIAELRHGLDSLAARIDTLVGMCDRPGLADRLDVVEGPFEGDAPAALDATRLWLERTRVMLTSPARTMADAHLAAGGLARRR